MTDKTIEELAINTIRFLAVDATNAAKSGHPGMPMGTAEMAATEASGDSDRRMVTMRSIPCCAGPAP